MPQHTVGDCKCEFIGSNATRLVSMIEVGDDPVVSCCYSSSKLELDIIPAKIGLKYIAIFHVWSGVLGNSYGNTIPRCQLHRLKHMVADLSSTDCLGGQFRKLSHHSPGKVFFWLDTLCIPVGHAVEHARRRSIAAMAKIYSRAWRVLVLDPELQGMYFNKTSPELALAHILCCAGMCRCWNLQEASLARSCYVQFADRAVALQILSSF